MKIGTIIQARCSSARLPNKVLLSLPYDSNISVLEQIIKRAKRIEKVDEIIMATTDNKIDDAVESVASKLNIKCFRGDEYNVLSRLFFAAEENNVDIIVRLTGDNPCIDYNLINLLLDFHIKGKNDYTATEYYPLGVNADIISFSAIKKAFAEVSASPKKEYMAPHTYLYMNPDKFKIFVKKAQGKYYHPDIRLTLDTEQDYVLLCAVFDYLYPKNEFFNTNDIINLFKEKLWLKLINKKIVQKEIFNSLEDELKEAIKILDLQELTRARDFISEYLSK